MKRRAIIIVDIDSDRPGISAMMVNWIPWLVRVRIRSDIKHCTVAPEKDLIVASTLHELGHAAGFILLTDGYVGDPRKGERLPFTEERNQLIIQSEREAWQFAETMFWKVKDFFLGSYEARKASLWDTLRDMIYGDKNRKN